MKLTKPKASNKLLTDKAVIWYRSDKFPYLAPLPTPKDESAPRLAALDIKLVRAIIYVREPVKVLRGGEVERVRITQDTKKEDAKKKDP